MDQHRPNWPKQTGRLVILLCAVALLVLAAFEHASGRSANTLQNLLVAVITLVGLLVSE